MISSYKDVPLPTRGGSAEPFSLYIVKIQCSNTPAQVLCYGPICRAAHDMSSAVLGQVLAGGDVNPNEDPWPWEGLCRDW